MCDVTLDTNSYYKIYIIKNVVDTIYKNNCFDIFSLRLKTENIENIIYTFKLAQGQSTAIYLGSFP